MEIVDFLWIVPSTNDLARKPFKSRNWEKEFTVLHLSRNFRNSREIVKTTKSVAEEQGYAYRKGIVMPPENFPTGCCPIFVDTFEEATKEARKRTKDGILVICVPWDTNGNHLTQMNEKWKRYGDYQNDFKESENPYKFLQE